MLNNLLQCHADYRPFPYSISHSTVSGIAAYRSALTLDWLAEQDSRQREVAHVFESDGTLYKETDQWDCISSSRPSGGKVARLMLELLKNLEGDDGVIQKFTQTLTRADILVEFSQLEVEPNLDSLVQTSRLMQGEPHATLPRILAVVWLLASDPITTQTSGWCSIEKLTQFLATTSPAEIAAHMRTVDPILARARSIMEEFMQNVAPLHLKRHALGKSTQTAPLSPSAVQSAHERKKSTRSAEVLLWLGYPYDTEVSPREPGKPADSPKKLLFYSLLRQFLMSGSAP